MVDRTQLVSGVLLLAIVPVVLYALGVETIAAVSVVNVLLVAGCLFYMFGPASAPHRPTH